MLLGHPGGPFWANRDLGAWTLPKGEIEGESEDPLDAAKREFAEETGFSTGTHWLPLGETRQRSGKLVMAWAFEGDCDPVALVSNAFEMEWPLRSGKVQSFPEIDRAAWFAVEAARAHIHEAQIVFLNRLQALVG